MQQSKPPDPPLCPPTPDISSRPSSLPHSRSIPLSSKQASAPNAFPGPSSGLLALLVTVAGSSSVHGRPLESDIPPDFLCPRLHVRSSQPIPAADSPWVRPPCDEPQASSSSKPQSSPADDSFKYLLPPRKKRASVGVNIADKYEQSSDGRWRKVNSWELYGSSSCAITQCLDSPATQLPVEEDKVTGSSGFDNPTLSTSPTAMTPSLPNGWDKHSSSDAMTGMILALSLSLACSLIVFMMGIVLWRKKRRKHTDDDDAEKITSSWDADDDASEEAKRARSQQRMWARASARWMANVRHSARRRRKRFSAVVVKGSDVGPFNDSQTAQASSSAVSLSRTQTAGDSDSSHWSRPRSVRSRSRTRSRSRSIISASSRSHQEDDSMPPPSHPPAYIPDSCPPRHPSTSHALPSASPVLQSSPLSPLPYEPPIHSGHVATDDKMVLAQMARLASAPPSTDEPSSLDASGRPPELHPSVPVFEDDGFEVPPTLLQPGVTAANEERMVLQSSSAPDVLGPALETSSPYLDLSIPIDAEVPSYTEDALRHRTLILPPPSSKVVLTGPMFYEYPNEFEEDVATVDAPIGPSSPPFEERSAPPFEYIEDPAGGYMIVPSAPPLDLSDAFPPSPEGLTPSAPPLDLNEEPSSHEASIRSERSRGELSAPPLTPDDHGSVSSGAASPLQAPRFGDVSPPQYLP